ncbi:uncharacterized protein LOC134530674 [Bacillus rossius redtenbacheri]|uniref:uncharacterized protein LOC134530674 n=1 Tax=Bacillus rossius redtenbacheri TaxID=93214 RepID=UPI002FDF0855
MNGPNVNLKFHKDLIDDFTSDDPDSPEPLSIGTCGLHRLHCAFKAAMQSTQWDIVGFLRSLYNLFKNVPARRADYIHYSGSTNFSLKFCAVRWLQNIEVAERAFTILTCIEKYVAGVQAAKKVPGCRSFQVVSAAIKDKLLAAKLAFFQSVAAEVEPFLRVFQADTPLAPFLYEYLNKNMISLGKRFIKPEFQTEFESKLIISEEKLMTAKNFDLGYGTRDALRKVKNVTEKDILVFRQECKICLKTFCNKLLVSSPLRYKLTKGISCLDPGVAQHASVRDRRLCIALEVLVTKKWVSGAGRADHIDRQFKSICCASDFVGKMKGFSKKSDRLKTLWLSLIASDAEYGDLKAFLKIVFLISHGNSALERGFSLKKSAL